MGNKPGKSHKIKFVKLISKRQVTPRAISSTLQSILEDQTLRRNLENTLIKKQCLPPDTLTTLQFWHSCRQLQRIHMTGHQEAVEQHLKTMYDKFFGVETNKLLSESITKGACRNTCKKQQTTQLQPLWLIQNEISVLIEEQVKQMTIMP